MQIIKILLRKTKSLLKKIFRVVLKLPFFKIKKNKIVFDNFCGKGFGCNPKYIALEIISQNLDYDLVWLVNDLEEEIPKQIRKVKYGSFQALYELATAKVWIDNVRIYKGVDKKKGQFYIQTWHGAIGMKKVEKEVEEFLSDNYIKESKNDGKITDLMLSNNSMLTESYRKSFWYDGPILEVGLPRNDVIINPPKDLKDKVCEYFNINEGKSFVIYAPTFRKDLDLEVYRFDYDKVLSVIKQKFDKDFILLIRLHPNVSEKCNFIEYGENIINATNYPDCQELLAISDVCISDYSSTQFDFSMVNKPVFLLCKDKEQYIKNERKLYFKFEELPFTVATNEEELIYNIQHFDNEEYTKICEEFYGKYDLKNNSNSAKEIVKIISEKMKS